MVTAGTGSGHLLSSKALCTTLQCTFIGENGKKRSSKTGSKALCVKLYLDYSTLHSELVPYHYCHYIQIDSGYIELNASQRRTLVEQRKEIIVSFHIRLFSPSF